MCPFSGKTRSALCSSLSIKISASVFLPHLMLLLSVLLTESYSSFLLSSPPPPPSLSASLPPLIPPSSFLKATCSQPVWLSCTLPMKGFLLGWDWVQPSRAWLRAEAGASLANPPQPPSLSFSSPTPFPTAQTTPHARSGLALSPRRRLLVSAALNCRQQLKRARERERHCGERRGNSVGLLSCYLTRLDSKVCVPAVKSWLCISWFY